MNTRKQLILIFAVGLPLVLGGCDFLEPPLCNTLDEGIGLVGISVQAKIIGTDEEVTIEAPLRVDVTDCTVMKGDISAIRSISNKRNYLVIFSDGSTAMLSEDKFEIIEGTEYPNENELR